MAWTPLLPPPPKKAERYLSIGRNKGAWTAELCLLLSGELGTPDCATAFGAQTDGARLRLEDGGPYALYVQKDGRIQIKGLGAALAAAGYLQRGRAPIDSETELIFDLSAIWTPRAEATPAPVIEDRQLRIKEGCAAEPEPVAVACPWPEKVRTSSGMSNVDVLRGDPWTLRLLRILLMGDSTVGRLVAEGAAESCAKLEGRLIPLWVRKLIDCPDLPADSRLRLTEEGRRALDAVMGAARWTP